MVSPKNRTHREKINFNPVEDLLVLGPWTLKSWLQEPRKNDQNPDLSMVKFRSWTGPYVTGWDDFSVVEYLNVKAFYRHQHDQNTVNIDPAPGHLLIGIIYHAHPPGLGPDFSWSLLPILQYMPRMYHLERTPDHVDDMWNAHAESIFFATLR